MRRPIRSSLKVGGAITVGQAIARVDDVVRTWSNKYRHTTRALGVKRGTIIELETLFSKPTEEKPVPVAAVCVHFTLDVNADELSYRFEQESVRHKVGGQSLAEGCFERWLDWIISDKLQVRQLHDLATPFEETRLVDAPPVVLESLGTRENLAEKPAELEVEVTIAQMTTAPLLSPSWTGQPEAALLPLDALLANIFDAADEASELELTHKEVADLLYATPLGLADWDLKLLLTTAVELDTGKIEWKPFVEAAPDIILSLRKRRAAYLERNQPSARVTHEAIDLCFGEEIEEAARAVREACASCDTGATGTLSRHDFRECLMSRGERLSMQEVQMLMQMCKEDDAGQVPYDDFMLLLQQVRIDALHNALIETDIKALRMHLILLLRKEGMGPDLIMPIWSIRNVLLSADQICLSRMQIHVLLSIVHPNEHGEVDVQYFLQVACTVIPYLFDAVTFMEKAAAIAKEKADALAKQELEELQGITSSLAAKRHIDDEDLEDTHVNAPDRDAVEKALIHIGNLYDDKHKSQASLEVHRFLEAMRHEQVQQCQLTDAELRGFVAEAELDERREVAYVDHVKMWVPILFEVRKSRIYETILAKDWGAEAGNLIDLSSYETHFPILPEEEEAEDDGDDALGSSRSSSRASGSSGASPRRRSSRGSSGPLEVPGSRVGSEVQPMSRETDSPAGGSPGLPGHGSPSEQGAGRDKPQHRHHQQGQPKR